MKIFQTKSILFAIATAMVVVTTLPILQSCSNDEAADKLNPMTTAIGIEPLSKSKKDNIIKSKEYSNYVKAFTEFSDKTDSVINGLTIEEKQLFHENVNNQEFLMAFFVKHNLVGVTQKLSDEGFKFAKKSRFGELTENDRLSLFSGMKFSSNKNLLKNKRFKITSKEACQRDYDEEMIALKALEITALGLCLYGLPTPPIYLACTISAFTVYELAAYKAEKEYKACMGIQ